VAARGAVDPDGHPLVTARAFRGLVVIVGEVVVGADSTG
jgi:hypothetical protein